MRRLAATTRPLPTPWPAEARDQLVTLLGAGRSTVPVWEALEAEGLITRLLPDWERVRCRPQRNAVHTWTVDRHLVETAVRAASLTRRVSRPDLLLVAALLHDIGKGWPGDHSVAGEIITRDVAGRLGFDRHDTAVLATLVRHHLLLVETATRRDLDDPATVRSVADVVGSQTTLELLHALTEADALATGPAAWSAWRDSLVTDLVGRVGAVLAGEEPEEPAVPAPTAEQERLAVEAYRTRGPVLALHARAETLNRDGAEDGADDAADGADTGQEPLGVELVLALPARPAQGARESYAMGVLPAVAGVLALHRLTVRTAELSGVSLPRGLDGAPGPPPPRPPTTRPASCCSTGASPPSTAPSRRRPGSAPTWSAPSTARSTSAPASPNATPPTRAVAASPPRRPGSASPPPPPTTPPSSRYAPRTPRASSTASARPWRATGSACAVLMSARWGPMRWTPSMSPMRAGGRWGRRRRLGWRRGWRRLCGGDVR